MVSLKARISRVSLKALNTMFDCWYSSLITVFVRRDPSH